MKYQFDFTDKIVLITGASRGIGRAIAEGFSSLGAISLLVGRNVEKLNETEAAILEQGGKCIKIQADINVVSQVDTMINNIKRDFNRVDILINNAGVGHRIPSIDVTEEQWKTVLDTNLNTPFFLSTKIAKEFMIPQKCGKIVNTASMGGFSGIPMSAAYSSSKGGILQMTRSLAAEWAKYNIQVNCICPHYTKTDLIQEAMSNEDWIRLVASRTPIGRLAEPEETVGAALFLASHMASYITGTYIQIDGGCYGGGF
ncbi:SDR family NAD(P)-dependent oxidoreductase [Cytobacillus sp. Hz8]|uniref:SDR family NAD(P)-dependent oxidoreductase n=1 Tax=Cytobacillus sp. Hz8 TaxID=3347168 RepID=UPI0035D70EB2